MHHPSLHAPESCLGLEICERIGDASIESSKAREGRGEQEEPGLDSELACVIDAIHASPRQVVIEFTGAGAQALAWLHGRAGSSRTVLEASDRYAPASLAQALRVAPRKHVHPDVARSLASTALARAYALAGPREGLTGLGWTAAIATGRQRRGDHRCHLALCDASGMSSFDLHLDKGARTREQEEYLVALLAVRALAAGVPGGKKLPLPLGARDRLEHRHETSTLIARVTSGDFDWLLRSPEGAETPGRHLSGAVLLCGSFNPLHDAHRRLAEVAAGLLGRDPMFELGLVNADKAPIAEEEAERRAAQFAGYAPVLLSAEPRFADKVGWVRESVFVLGADTLARLVDPRFYGRDRGEMLHAFARIRESGCRFLVAARLDPSGGRVRTLADCAVPRGFERLFESIPVADFRMDLSSTELRERRRALSRPRVE